MPQEERAGRAATDLFPREREVRILDVDLDLAMLAGDYKRQNRLSFADAFALATAERESPAVLVTGDPEIRAAKVEPSKVQIRWLERTS